MYTNKTTRIIDVPFEQVQWRARKLCCFSCADIVKREEAQKRSNPQPAPKRKNISGVDIPTKLISPKNALPWEIQHRKWDMNRVIANEMAHLQYMTWSEMKAMVTKQNCKNTIALVRGQTRATQNGTQ